MKRWMISAGTPDGLRGEREGWVDTAPDATEEEARAAYLAERPTSWVIHTIHPQG